MAKILRLRRGNTAAHSTFTGKLAEVTVDTTKNTIVVHDNATVGGHPLATESYVNTQVSNIIAGNLNFGDIDISANEISTVNTNQDLVLSPNGTGNVTVNSNLHIENNGGLRLGTNNQLSIRYREGDGNPWDRVQITTAADGNANIALSLYSNDTSYMFFNPLNGNIGINTRNTLRTFTVQGDIKGNLFASPSGFNNGFRFEGPDNYGLTGVFHVDSGNATSKISVVHDGQEGFIVYDNSWSATQNLNVYNDLIVDNLSALKGKTYVNDFLNFPATGANLQYAGNQDYYFQLVTQNKNSANAASTDYIATSDNGNDNQGFIDLGINSSNYNDPDFSITGAGDGYVYVHGVPNVGGNLAIGTVHNNDIIFHTGGTTAANEIARFAHGQGLKVYGNITPGANVTYNLGEPGNEWNSLYVSGNTIYIGGVPLSVDNTGNLIAVT